VIRDTRFLISRKPYAVDLTTFRGAEVKERHWAVGTRYHVSAYIDAVWYRRKAGRTRACIGALGLWSQNLKQPVDPLDPLAVLSADLDSRYGGDCHGRWDGTGYWGAEQPDVAAEHLELLRPMLANYPAIPDGFDGWYHF
jgi:hypothetical protein